MWLERVLKLRIDVQEDHDRHVAESSSSAKASSWPEGAQQLGPGDHESGRRGPIVSSWDGPLGSILVEVYSVDW